MLHCVSKKLLTAEIIAVVLLIVSITWLIYKNHH